MRAGTSGTIKGCSFLSVFTKGMEALWYKDRKVYKTAEYDVTQNSKTNYMMTFKDLQFDSFTLEDEGSYYCSLTTHANAPFKSASVSITLQGNAY